jgi:hypothetical protein
MDNDGTEDYISTGTNTVNATGGLSILSFDFNGASAVTTTVDNGLLTIATVDTNDDASATTLKTSSDGAITITGAVTSSGDAGGNAVNILLEEGTTLTMSGTAASNATINGGVGTFTVAASAVRTQTGIIGGGERLGTLDVDGTLTMGAVASSITILDLDGTINGTGTTLNVSETSVLDGSIDVTGGIVFTGASTVGSASTLEVDAPVKTIPPVTSMLPSKTEVSETFNVVPVPLIVPSKSKIVIEDATAPIVKVPSTSNVPSRSPPPIIPV